MVLVNSGSHKQKNFYENYLQWACALQKVHQICPKPESLKVSRF